MEEPIPPDCFRLEELQLFQSFEGQILIDVNYYLWLNNTEPGIPPLRFLYGLELVFDRDGALLLSSGEDSTAIRSITAEALLKTAQTLQTLHNQVAIQRVHAGAFPLWEPAVGQSLQAIRLSRGASGFYLNDALVLDFGEKQILLQLSQKEGLELGPFG